MTRPISAFAIAVLAAFLSFPVQANSAERAGIRNSQPHEFSSRHRGHKRSRVAGMHYYDPYPWWWYPPHLKRARTNYLGWPHTHYPPDYDLPYFDGVAGHPGGFWLHGL